MLDDFVSEGALPLVLACAWSQELQQLVDKRHRNAVIALLDERFHKILRKCSAWSDVNYVPARREERADPSHQAGAAASCTSEFPNTVDIMRSLDGTMPKYIFLMLKCARCVHETIAPKA